MHSLFRLGLRQDKTKLSMWDYVCILQIVYVSIYRCVSKSKSPSLGGPVHVYLKTCMPSFFKHKHQLPWKCVQTVQAILGANSTMPSKVHKQKSQASYCGPSCTPSLPQVCHTSPGRRGHHQPTSCASHLNKWILNMILFHPPPPLPKKTPKDFQPPPTQHIPKDSHLHPPK